MVRSKVSLQKMKNHFVKAPYTNWYLHSNRNFLRRLLGKKMEIIITTPLDRTTSYFFFFFFLTKSENIQFKQVMDKTKHCHQLSFFLLALPMWKAIHRCYVQKLADDFCVMLQLAATQVAQQHRSIDQAISISPMMHQGESVCG